MSEPTKVGSGVPVLPPLVAFPPASSIPCEALRRELFTPFQVEGGGRLSIGYLIERLFMCLPEELDMRLDEVRLVGSYIHYLLGKKEKRPADCDIRIYLSGDFSAERLGMLAEKIIHAAGADKKRSFSSLQPVFTKENHFLALTFQNSFFDLTFVANRHLYRECLFTWDDPALCITSFFDRGASPPKLFSQVGRTSPLFKDWEQKRIVPAYSDRFDSKDWLRLLAMMVKGGWCDHEGGEAKWFAAFREVFSGAHLIEKFLRTHFPNDPAAHFCFCFNALRFLTVQECPLTPYFDYKEISINGDSLLAHCQSLSFSTLSSTLRCAARFGIRFEGVEVIEATHERQEPILLIKIEDYTFHVPCDGDETALDRSLFSKLLALPLPAEGDLAPLFTVLSRPTFSYPLIRAWCEGDFSTILKLQKRDLSLALNLFISLRENHTPPKMRTIKKLLHSPFSTLRGIGAYFASMSEPRLFYRIYPECLTWVPQLEESLCDAARPVCDTRDSLEWTRALILSPELWEIGKERLKEVRDVVDFFQELVVDHPDRVLLHALTSPRQLLKVVRPLIKIELTEEHLKLLSFIAQKLHKSLGEGVKESVAQGVFWLAKVLRSKELLEALKERGVPFSEKAQRLAFELGMPAPKSLLFTLALEGNQSAYQRLLTHSLGAKELLALLAYRENKPLDPTLLKRAFPKITDEKALLFWMRKIQKEGGTPPSAHQAAVLWLRGLLEMDEAEREAFIKLGIAAGYEGVWKKIEAYLPLFEARASELPDFEFLAKRFPERVPSLFTRARSLDLLQQVGIGWILASPLVPENVDKEFLLPIPRKTHSSRILKSFFARFGASVPFIEWPRWFQQRYIPKISEETFGELFAAREPHFPSFSRLERPYFLEIFKRADCDQKRLDPLLRRLLETGGKKKIRFAKEQLPRLFKVASAVSLLLDFWNVATQERDFYKKEAHWAWVLAVWNQIPLGSPCAVDFVKGLIDGMHNILKEESEPVFKLYQEARQSVWNTVSSSLTLTHFTQAYEIKLYLLKVMMDSLEKNPKSGYAGYLIETSVRYTYLLGKEAEAHLGRENAPEVKRLSARLKQMLARLYPDLRQRRLVQEAVMRGTSKRGLIIEYHANGHIGKKVSKAALVAESLYEALVEEFGEKLGRDPAT